MLNKPVPVQRSNIGRRCYICSSPNHISTTCPQRNINGTNKPQLKPRINACVAQMAESVGERNSPQMNVDQTQGAELYSSTPLGPVKPLQSHSRSQDLEPVVDHVAVRDIGGRSGGNSVVVDKDCASTNSVRGRTPSLTVERKITAARRTQLSIDGPGASNIV